MSLARDFAKFARAVNTDLDKVVNDMAEQSQRVDELKTEQNDLMGGVFERLGTVMQRLEGLAQLETDVATVKRLVISIHDGHVHDMRDVRKRLGVLEAKAIDVTHPDEEVTPAARPSLPRR
jgi:uncharacterized coiled-coil DUF342 family protein